MKELIVIEDKELQQFFSTSRSSFNGKRADVNYLSKYFPEVLDKILNTYNLTLPVDGLEFQGLCYRIFNNITECPRCIACGEYMDYNLKIHGYPKLFCCNECRKSDIGQKIINEQRQKTILSKYGDKCFLRSQDGKDMLNNNGISFDKFEKKLKNEIVDVNALYSYVDNHNISQLSKYCNKNPNTFLVSIINQATSFVDDITEDDVMDGTPLEEYKSVQYRLNCIKLSRYGLRRCPVCGKVFNLKRLYRLAEKRHSTENTCCSPECKKIMIEEQKEATANKNLSKTIYGIITDVPSLCKYIDENSYGISSVVVCSKIRPDSLLANAVIEATSYLNNITVDNILEGEKIEDYQTFEYRMLCFKYDRNELYRCPICNKLIPYKRFNNRLNHTTKNDYVPNAPLVCSDECNQEFLKIRREENRVKCFYDYIIDVDSLYSYIDENPGIVPSLVGYCNKEPDSVTARAILDATKYLDDITDDDIRDGENLEDFLSFTYRAACVVCCRYDLYRCPNCGKLLPVGQLRKLKNDDTVNAVFCSRECYDKRIVTQSTRDKQSKHAKEMWKNFTEEQIESLFDKVAVTNLERYGNKCSLHGPEQIEMKKQTWKEKYGEDIEWVSQAKEVIKKRDDTNIERYGGLSPLCAPEQQEKRLQTWKEKYDIDTWISQDKSVVDKMMETKRERYGDNIMSDEQIEAMMFTKEENTMWQLNNGGKFTPLKEFVFPDSGRTIYLQGYEPQALLGFLIPEYGEDDIVGGSSRINAFKFHYEYEGKIKKYVPDFYIKSVDTFYEIKSKYTLLLQLDRNILKIKSVLDAGHNILVAVVETKQLNKEQVYKTHTLLTYEDLVEMYERLSNYVENE